MGKYREINVELLNLIYPYIKYIKKSNVAVVCSEDFMSNNLKDYQIISTENGEILKEIKACRMHQSDTWIWFTGYKIIGVSGRNSEHLVVNVENMEEFRFNYQIMYNRCGRIRVWRDNCTAIVLHDSRVYYYDNVYSFDRMLKVGDLRVLYKDSNDVTHADTFDDKLGLLNVLEVVNRYYSNKEKIVKAAKINVLSGGVVYNVVVKSKHKYIQKIHNYFGDQTEVNREMLESIGSIVSEEELRVKDGKILY